jgi:hypothetical protein
MSLLATGAIARGSLNSVALGTVFQEDPHIGAAPAGCLINLIDNTSPVASTAATVSEMHSNATRVILTVCFIALALP